MDSDQFSISVSVPLDEDGYFDRRCPSTDCDQPFKVLFEDWRDKVADEVAYCPFCRHECEAQEYNTEAQSEYVREMAMAEMQRRVGAMLTGMTRDFNRRQPRQSLLSIRMDVNHAPVPIPFMPLAEEQMTLRITCEECGCRVAVIGAGFFCPACGYNSADVMFDQALTKCRSALDALPAIRIALSDRDQQAQVTQSIIENQLANLVTAFSRFAEASYSRLPQPGQNPRRNAFQNLAEGNRLWLSAGGHDYATVLSQVDLAELRIRFQQRHLLEHQQGIVDQDYLDKSGDHSYRLGQRIVVRETMILHFAEILESLVNGLRSDLASTKPHP